MSNLQSLLPYRKQLTITTQELQLYDAIMHLGVPNAREIAQYMGIKTQAVYRLATTLEERQFITVQRQRPQLFRAVPLVTVLATTRQQTLDTQAAMQAIITQTLTRQHDTQTIDIIHGRAALYDRYILEAQQAQYEIVVFSIGIAYNDRLYTVQSEARQRGVEIRHIVQQYTKSNYHIIKKWQRLGVKMRLYETAVGFHVMVFDGKTLLLSFSDPNDTDNRVSMVIHNTAAVNALREYYFTVWSQASLISGTSAEVS
jgi:sugar-specific transcriptional regulator TrmB